MPVFGIDLAAKRGAQRAIQDKPEQSCRAWYKSPVWKAIKRHRLSQEPNCRQCAQEGRFITATHVAHIAPPGDQWSQFMDYANTQSLCRWHHNAQRRLR
jgi:5-methylcytosine-specific restriction protein A